jgi:hypothetical protein
LSVYATFFIVISRQLLNVMLEFTYLVMLLEGILAWRRMYGRRASQLLKEIDSSEAGQLAPFNVILTSLKSTASTSLKLSCLCL